MKKSLIIVLAFILVLSSSLMACSNKKPVYADFLSDSEIEKIEKTINKTEFEEPTKPISSFVSYRLFPNDYKQIYSIGISGIPILIEKIDEAESINMRLACLIDSTYDLLRVDGIGFSYNDINIKIDDEIENVRRLKAFLAYSREQIPKIISSKIETKEKIDKLRTYGILCLPYITDEMINKNKEYAQIYTALGLHLETYEWAELWDAAEGDDVWYKSYIFLKGADEFNYKKWRKDNEEAINVLNDFVNELTADLVE